MWFKIKITWLNFANPVYIKEEIIATNVRAGTAWRQNQDSLL